MSLVYLGQHAIAEGKLDEAKTASEQMVAFVEANSNRLLQFGIAIDDKSLLMTVLQIHPDEDSLRQHVAAAGDRIKEAYAFLEGTTRIEIFGNPSDELMGLLTQMSGGAQVVYHRPLAGFNRF